MTILQEIQQRIATIKSGAPVGTPVEEVFFIGENNMHKDVKFIDEAQIEFLGFMHWEKCLLRFLYSYFS